MDPVCVCSCLRESFLSRFYNLGVGKQASGFDWTAEAGAWLICVVSVTAESTE